MTSVKIEFAVNMTCDNCVASIDKALGKVPDIKHYDINLEKGHVIVETNLPSEKVKRIIESTGRQAVLKGYGSQNLGSAVAMLGGTVGYGNIMGVVRFLQTDNNTCVIEGTIDGLHPGEHGLHVHECGDLSRGCQSVGDHYNPHGSKHGGPGDDKKNRHVGDLGNITADKEGRALFFKTDDILKLGDVIGRSVVVTASQDDCGKGKNESSKVDGNSGERLSCGIIARSAGMFQNSKKICACDGVSLWDERNKPLAGPGRQQSSL